MRPANAGGNVIACSHSLISKWQGRFTPIASATPSGSRALYSPRGSRLAGPIRSGSRAKGANHERAGPGALGRQADRAVLGGFKRSSQHSISRRLRWAGRRGGQRVRRAGRWSVRRGGRPRGGESIGCGSGPRSGVGSRAWRRLLRLACRRPLASDGSVRVAGCHLSLLPRCRGVTCRSPSGRRSLCCAPRSWGCARSPGGSVARRRRSRGSCAVTPGLAAAR